MNYVQYFRLREPPFGITPDTSFFYPCRSSQEAFNTLLVALGNGEGFIKITGEVGTGKTLLCRKLLGTLKEGWVSAYIANPALEPRALMLAFAEELGMMVDAAIDQHRLLKSITRTLLDLARNRRRVVLCMDEAQALPLETLEAVRLLTNLETEKRKLLQVVLFGQPELDRKLASPSIRQLRQRITFEHRLQAFADDEVGSYVAHRLSVAGYAGPPLFAAAALKHLCRASRGVPRLINVIAHKALLVAYGEGARMVLDRHVQAAVLDTPSANQRGRWWWLRPWADRPV
jgi:MSHA biogenesis protein MshM